MATNRDMLGHVAKAGVFSRVIDRSFSLLRGDHEVKRIVRKYNMTKADAIQLLGFAAGAGAECLWTELKKELPWSEN